MALKRVICLVLFCSIFNEIASESCKNPKVKSTSFTSQDATVITQIGYIAEFELACDNAIPENYALYAEVEGKPLTAARTGPGKYQVSWTEEIASSRRGTYNIAIVDEEGWASLRRARRTDPNAKPTPLVTVDLHHPGSYNGPWVNSEVMASVLSVLTAYTAIRYKSKLLA